MPCKRSGLFRGDSARRENGFVGTAPKKSRPSKWLAASRLASSQQKRRKVLPCPSRLASTHCFAHFDTSPMDLVWGCCFDEFHQRVALSKLSLQEAFHLLIITPQRHSLLTIANILQQGQRRTKQTKHRGSHQGQQMEIPSCSARRGLSRIAVSHDQPKLLGDLNDFAEIRHRLTGVVYYCTHTAVSSR